MFYLFPYPTLLGAVQSNSEPVTALFLLPIMAPNLQSQSKQSSSG